MTLKRRRWLQQCGTLAAVSAAPALLRARPAAGPGLASLAAGLAGDVISRADERYEIWRQSMVWQALKPARMPELIVQARNTADVALAVRHARAAGLQVAVRSGGHSWCHSSLREGGMLINLGRLRDVQLDVAGRRLVAGPAIEARELQRRLGEHGLAFPTAHCGSVALGGYLLGGGQAWNGAAWGGRACFSMTGFEMVTATGDVIRVSEDNHPELLWAARGCGPGMFGIITAFELQAWPLPQAITTSSYAFALEDAPAVAGWLREAALQLPDTVETLGFMAAPPGDGSDGRFFVSATAFVDTPARAREAMAALVDTPPPAAVLHHDAFVPTPFEALYDSVDRSFSRDRYVADTLVSATPLPTLMAQSVALFRAAPSPRAMVLCETQPRARQFPDAAFAKRGETSMIWYGLWRDPADDAANIGWLRDSMRALQPHVSGRFISEADIAHAPERVRETFTPAAWDRLAALRERWDPDRVFHSWIGNG